jgi:NAD(P)-dependent dehydrogenase (short-subunit alcohol dehydrogenase family)
LLAGRIAVITGGGGGIGAGIVRRFAAEGAVLVVNDIDPDLLDGIVAEVTALADPGPAPGTPVVEPVLPLIVPVLGDIRSPETVARLAETALEIDGGRVDVLVNNVGDYRPSGRFLRSTEDQWQAQYALNLEHVLRCTHTLAPAMVERGSGSIVNVSTVEAFRGIPGCAVYSAFNAGVNAFTKSLAVELGRDGVRVNAIAPDLTDTLQTPAAAMLRGRDPSLTRQWLPLGRFGQPDDFGDAALFLASDMSRFVTGHILPVDGGTTAASGWYQRSDGRGWTNLPTSP